MAACCFLRRQVTEGRQRRGIASGATEHLRTGNQPQSRKVVRSHDPAVAPAASGQIHRVGRARAWAPFAVIQASSACSVNSATKFFGMSAFRLSTISSAAARFSGDAGASLLYPSWDRTPLDMLGEPPVSTLRQRCFSPTFLIAYSAKGA